MKLILRILIPYSALTIAVWTNMLSTKPFKCKSSTHPNNTTHTTITKPSQSPFYYSVRILVQMNLCHFLTHAKLEMPPHRFKKTYKKRTNMKHICSCSPDVGDCPKCCKSPSPKVHRHRSTRKASAHNS